MFLLATSRTRFGNRVKQELWVLGLNLIRLENAELLTDQLLTYSIDPEFKEVAKRVANSDGVGFGTVMHLKCRNRTHRFNDISEG